MSDMLVPVSTAIITDYNEEFLGIITDADGENRMAKGGSFIEFSNEEIKDKKRPFLKAWAREPRRGF